MKKTRTFMLSISTYGVFQAIKSYLMQKYVVYTAKLIGNNAYFKIGYSI
jgi:hypothetical protein